MNVITDDAVMVGSGVLVARTYTVDAGLLLILGEVTPHTLVDGWGVDTDADLLDMQVVSVRPLPGGYRFMIRVWVLTTRDEHTMRLTHTVLERLEASCVSV